MKAKAFLSVIFILGVNGSLLGEEMESSPYKNPMNFHAGEPAHFSTESTQNVSTIADRVGELFIRQAIFLFREFKSSEIRELVSLFLMLETHDSFRASSFTELYFFKSGKSLQLKIFRHWVEVFFKEIPHLDGSISVEQFSNFFWIPIIVDLIYHIEDDPSADIDSKIAFAKARFHEALEHYVNMNPMERTVRFSHEHTIKVFDDYHKEWVDITLVDLIFDTKKNKSRSRHLLRWALVSRRANMIHYFDLLLAEQLYQEIKTGEIAWFMGVFNIFDDPCDQKAFLEAIENDPKLKKLYAPFFQDGKPCSLEDAVHLRYVMTESERILHEALSIFSVTPDKTLVRSLIQNVLFEVKVLQGSKTHDILVEHLTNKIRERMILTGFSGENVKDTKDSKKPRAK